jgi:hypothetical protein
VTSQKNLVVLNRTDDDQIGWREESYACVWRT